MKNLINCNCGATFLIKTIYSTGQTYICQKDGFLEALKQLEQSKSEIEKILIFDFKKHSFVRCSIKNIIFHMNYNTEFTEYVKKHYFFRSFKF